MLSSVHLPIGLGEPRSLAVPPVATGVAVRVVGFLVVEDEPAG